ncbi:MAG: ComEC/Rec2 family competence protein, partial [Clostridiales bacterium]
MRPLLYFVISFIVGICSIYNLISDSNVLISVVIIIIISIFIVIKYKVRKFILFGCVLFFILGIFEFLIVDNHLKSLESVNGNVKIKGKIIRTKNNIRSYNYEYIIKINEINGFKEKKIIKRRLKVYTQKETKFSYGDEIIFIGEIETPSIKNDFNEKNYLYSSKISGTINTKSVKIYNKNNSISLISYGLKLRNNVMKFITKNYKNKEAALLLGMIIGDDSKQSLEMVEEFRESGLSHIIVASGANLLYIIIPLVFIFKKLKIKSKYSNIIIISILFIYLLVTGFEPSIVRAFIMAVVLLLSKTIKKDYDPITGIAFAAIIVLIGNPYVLFNIGFQLSYLATLSIILFYKKINEKMEFIKIPSFIKDVIVVTVSVQIGVVPIMMFYFSKIPIISFISNILVVPITGFITGIGIFTFFFDKTIKIFNVILIKLNYYLLNFVIFISEKSADFKYSTFDFNIKDLNIVFLI